MLADARAGKFEVILAKTQSRFTRDMELVEKYLHGLFPEWGVRFIAVLDHVDTCDPAGKRHARSTDLSMSGTWRICPGMCGLCWTTSGAAGATLRALRSTATGRTRRITAVCSDEPAAQVVRQIFALYLQGNGAGRIADPQRAGCAAAVRLPRGQCWPAAPHARAAVVQRQRCGAFCPRRPTRAIWSRPRAQAELQVPQSHPPAAGGLDHRTRHPRAAHQPGGFCSRRGWRRMADRQRQRATRWLACPVCVCGGKMELTGAAARRYFRCRTACRTRPPAGQPYWPLCDAEALVEQLSRYAAAGQLTQDQAAALLQNTVYPPQDGITPYRAAVELLIEVRHVPGALSR